MLERTRKRLILLCSMIVFIPGLVVAGGGKSAGGSPPGMQKASPGVLKAADPIPDQYIVLFKDTAVDKQSIYNTGQVAADVAALADTLAHRYGAAVDKTWSQAVKGMAVRMDAKQAAILAKDPNVALVEQDGVVQATTTQTPATWGLDRVDQRNLPLNTTYTYTPTGAGVTVFVLDTGIRTTHQQFGGRATWGTNTTGDGINTDCNGHGTHVAGTIGSTTYGIAKMVNLKAVKVLDCFGSGAYSGVISGIDWVTRNKAPKSVANMSLGGGFSAALNTAVTNSIAAGVSYVIAAGNNYGQDACLNSPGSTPNAITVGSTTNTDQRSDFSNLGACLDIFAPGSDITSSWHTSNTDINIISGTSMASPHVAGVAALYLSTNTATPAQVTAALKQIATPNKVIDPGAGSPNKLLYSLVTPPDTTLPNVSLTSPTAGQILKGIRPFAATATDNRGVAKVMFYAGTKLLGTDTTSPYSVNWNTPELLNGTYAFTAKASDAAGNTKVSVPVEAKIANTGTCSAGSQKILNPGFESSGLSWKATRGAIWEIGADKAHGGSWVAWLNGYGRVSTDNVYQQVSIPANACSATFSFWLKITTEELTTTNAFDTLSVKVGNTAGAVLGTLATFSNLNSSNGYVLKSFDVTAYKGQTIRLQFLGVEDISWATSFFVDDVSLIERH